MKHIRSYVTQPLRLLAIAASLVVLPAFADEYAEVSQLVRSGKLPDALAKADQFLTTKPRDPQMRFLKGVIQRDAGKTADAIATFNRLTEDYPELPEPYNNLAVLYAGQSQFDKARTALEMAIRTNPSYATAHENLGDVYAKLASQAYTKALQLDTANPAVPPKLALIRELFNPVGGKANKALPATTPPVVAAPPAVPVAKPAPPAPAVVATAVVKPVAVAPAMAAAPVPAPKPVVPAPATAPEAAPPLPKPGPTVTAMASASGSNTDVEAAVHAWASAWSAKDVKSYLALYGSEFVPPGAQSRNTWEEERRHRITSKAKISVKIENINVSTSGNRAWAKFRQDYKAGTLAVSSRKTLELLKKGDHWVIVKESVGG